MKTKLLKNSLLMVALFVATLGFSQPVITLVDIVQVGTISEGATATFTLTYKTDAAGPDIATNTQRLYLPGTGAVSPGFAEIIYSQTNGANTTIDVSFTWPVGFASGTYDYRFFNSAPKTDFNWAPLEDNYIGKNKSFGGATFEPETDYLGLMELAITVEPVLSVKENTLEGVSIYPNPASGFVNVSSLNGGDISVYSILGARVLTATATSKNHQLNVSSLKSGIYLLKIVSDNKSLTKKIIIN